MFKDFLLHILPRVTIKKNLKITYTFCLGGLAIVAFLISSFSGMLLLFYYQPSIEGAYSSILFLEESVFLGKYVRNIHRFSSNCFLVFIFLHTLRVVLTGAFLSRKYNWVVGMLLLILAIFEGYTGYLLPLDQLALWATKTGMELLKALPFGDIIYKTLAPDGIVGKLTLTRFYALHIFIIPAAIVILSTIHLFKVRRDKGVLPYL